MISAILREKLWLEWSFEDIEFQQLLNENQTQAQKKLTEQFGMTRESIGIQEDIIIDKIF